MKSIEEIRAAAARRQRALRERREADGLIEVRVYATRQHAKLIKQYAKSLGQSS